MAIFYLSLGSNIYPEENLKLARKYLKENFSLQKESKIYKTKSEGFVGNDFLNQVLCLKTNNSAESIIEIIKNIEKKIGRKERKEKFSEREIDIDLLIYDQVVGKVSGKEIPHKDIDLYRFVLEPLLEIAPNLIHPKHQKKISELWNENLDRFS